MAKPPPQIPSLTEDNRRSYWLGKILLGEVSRNSTVNRVRLLWKFKFLSSALIRVCRDEVISPLPGNSRETILQMEISFTSVNVFYKG